MNTPRLTTPRLILRRFAEGDAPALLAILGDEEVNRFLPMFPLRTLEEAQDYLKTRYLEGYDRPQGYQYAICRRADHALIGYISIADGDSHDLGYGLKRDAWGHGYAVEAGRAVIDAAKAGGLPYLTATHDVNNPASGAVMKKLGMVYQYSYVEQWQPKDFPVTFRLYQLNLDGAERVYRKYWERYPKHFVEENL